MFLGHREKAGNEEWVMMNSCRSWLTSDQPSLVPRFFSVRLEAVSASVSHLLKQNMAGVCPIILEERLMQTVYVCVY